MNLFPVVGLGASAGGLDALLQFFSTLSATLGMAYVVVQHLDPTHTSLLPSLLARATSLPVQEGQEGIALEPNHIYVTPPHADMTLEHGVLRLFPRVQEHGRRFAIDSFFFSLAHERGPQAIGVLLSGTASDGTVGLQEIKAEGGITFAQDEHTAAFPQMPHHAIATGCVDYILPPQDIARDLAHLHFHPARTPTQQSELPIISEQEEQVLHDLLGTLSLHTGVDFFAYKYATLIRRAQLRMSVLHLSHLAEYATYLREHPAEKDFFYWGRRRALICMLCSLRRLSVIRNSIAEKRSPSASPCLIRHWPERQEWSALPCKKIRGGQPCRTKISCKK
jgi:two-component system CheB/CheR fusion protein